MRNRIRVLAMTVVAAGGATLATPRPAEATYVPPPGNSCCCQVVYGRCVMRCCSPLGCTATPDGCRIGTT
jgi:hypothetical protein